MNWQRSTGESKARCAEYLGNTRAISWRSGRAMCAEGRRGGHLEVVAMFLQLDGENQLRSGDFNLLLPFDRQNIAVPDGIFFVIKS